MSDAELRVVRHFGENLKSIEDLMGFDDFLIDFVLKPLSEFRDHLEEIGTRPNHRPDAIVRLLQNLKRNQSVRPHYEVMYNQCLVLLVSHFASALRDVFIDAASSGIAAGGGDGLLEAEVKLTARDVREGPSDLPHLLAESLADAKDISYQDMGSVDRSFRRFFAAAVDRDAVVNDIIAAQACRHAIVHNGGKVTRRILNQVRSATPRSFRPDLNEGESIAVTREELTSTAAAMRNYLTRLCSAIEAQGIRLSRQATV